MKHHLRFVVIAAAVFGLVGFKGIESTLASQTAQKAAAGPMLIAEVDLECSFFICDSTPKIRLSSPIRTGEKTVLTEGDQFYSEPAPEAELFRENDAWSILEFGSRIRGKNSSGTLGMLAFQRGRARVIRIEDGRALMQIEKACGAITKGNFLIPFKKGSILRGPELAYNFPFRKGDALTAQVILLDSNINQIARGHWALIDIGADQGLEPGRQLTAFRKEGTLPPQAIGNVIVIRVGARWATIKVLDSKDGIQMGDLIQVK